MARSDRSRSRSPGPPFRRGLSGARSRMARAPRRRRSPRRPAIRAFAHGLPAGLLSYFDWFAIGMSLAMLSVALQSRARPPAPVRFISAHPGAVWGIGLVVHLVLCAVLSSAPAYAYYSPAQTIIEHVGESAVALFVVLPAVLGERRVGWPRRLLADRRLMWMGGSPTGSISGTCRSRSGCSARALAASWRCWSHRDRRHGDRRRQLLPCRAADPALQGGPAPHPGHRSRGRSPGLSQALGLVSSHRLVPVRAGAMPCFDRSRHID